MPVDGQAAQKFGHVLFIKLTRMPFAMKKNVTANPAHVCLFGPQTVMTQSHKLPDLVE